MALYKIVITGGPCGGKTSALHSIREHFERNGYAVIVISETATEFISSGIAPWTLESTYQYQKFQMKYQLQREKVYSEASGYLQNDNIILICDRGLMDNRVYMQEEEFLKILKDFKLSEKEILQSYDAVFHLVTAAKGAEQYYTLSNNEARTESIDVAAKMDDEFIRVWKDHPYFCVIDNSTDFQEKIRRLLVDIEQFISQEAKL